eukprot:CAMPEP_0119155570 /NCGR_PEP_ID=MMETSP1310-20130426/51809_1 /TAXON_ID=464262 /ORGANISM="Genus nov. species nov., Strain RCC2339" /LENGTH=426 /DNA_ID=CAMNT_0007148169 /DNA_START=170 /DNA_END=1450 /DNA_ORIENTATION=+
MAHQSERNQEATLFVGELDNRANEALLWELFLQAGPVAHVHIPKDKLTGEHQGFGFVEFYSEVDADYAGKIMNMVKLYGRPLRVNKASRDKNTLDVGANLFIGNLDPEVDEKLLYDTFSAFGVIINTPKIVQGERCFGFVSFDCFEASDAALAAMNGQYLCNRPIHVSYAIKKDSTRGERHGDMAERMLAASRTRTTVNRPHTLFAANSGGGTGANAVAAPTPQHQPPAPQRIPPAPPSGQGAPPPPQQMRMAFPPPPYMMGMAQGRQAMAQGGQPVGMAQGGQPMGMPQGGQPVGMAQGGQPVGMAHGVKPMGMAQGGQPLGMAQGGQPVGMAQVGQPMGMPQGGQPVGMAQGGQPMGMAQVGQTMGMPQGGRPGFPPHMAGRPSAPHSMPPGYGMVPPGMMGYAPGVPAGMPPGYNPYQTRPQT